MSQGPPVQRGWLSGCCDDADDDDVDVEVTIVVDDDSMGAVVRMLIEMVSMMLRP